MSQGLPVAEGVTLGSHVSLDPRLWRQHEGDTFFGLDRAELAITAQGYLKLDEMTHIHRFYTDEEVMLQIGTAAAHGGKADDLTIFHGLWSHVPRSEHERLHFIDRMRKPWFDHEGVRYDRFWLPGYENDQDPVVLNEAVYEGRSGRPTRNVVQVCMLYSRPLEAGGSELLLALEVAPEQGGLVQELMVGLPITAAEFFA